MDIHLGCLLETIGARHGVLRASFAFSFFVAMVPPALGDDLAGQASIIDGDTLEIHGTRANDVRAYRRHACVEQACGARV
jgi:hypothetical protein